MAQYHVLFNKPEHTTVATLDEAVALAQAKYPDCVFTDWIEGESGRAKRFYANEIDRDLSEANKAMEKGGLFLGLIIEDSR